jgi:hypothetical protein
VCVREAACCSGPAKAFFFLFLNSHNPCSSSSFCRALPYIHMGPAILRAVAGGKEHHFPCCRHLLCKLAKKRSGVVVVGLCIQMILFFLHSHFWTGHISASAITSKRNTSPLTLPKRKPIHHFSPIPPSLTKNLRINPSTSEQLILLTNPNQPAKQNKKTIQLIRFFFFSF